MKPIDFIAALRNSDEYIRHIYMNGGCWQFHLLLKEMYPTAKPYKACANSQHLFDHVITLIDGAFYDITGPVFPQKYYSIKAVSPQDLPELEKWNFARNNLLYKQCPHCGEEIYLDIKTKMAHELLTLAQVKQLQGRPIWIYGQISPFKPGCKVVDLKTDALIFFTDATLLEFAYYGKTWFAYKEEC